MNAIPILTYHALHAPGWEYHSNDHVAFAADLALLRELGFRVVSLRQIVDALVGGSLNELSQHRVVGISFDDGTDHDWIDYSHPGWGSLRSMATILRVDGAGMGLNGESASGTSFVIVSPDARDQLDQACSAGRGQWQDSWWKQANDSGLLTIANHSWDHLHPALEEVRHSRNVRGDFCQIDNECDADSQVLEAEHYLVERLGKSEGLFAYPFGHVAPYLRDHYFPNGNCGIDAAFATGGSHCTARSSRWAIPRWVCQEHWNSPEQLRDLLSK